MREPDIIEHLVGNITAILSTTDMSIKEVFEELEFELIRKALREHEDTIEAADWLGITRTCLCMKRKKHGLKMKLKPKKKNGST